MKVRLLPSLCAWQILLIFALIPCASTIASPKAWTTTNNSAISITGIVTDATDGSPLIGVSVIVEGTTTGTTTDIDGSYRIEVPDANAVLTFSYIGYKSQKVTVGSQLSIDILLAADIQALEEVVVVGYGNQKRANVTGAIATIDAAEITEIPVFTADQALQGRAPGVMVMNNGSPGTDPVVRIRGLGTTGNNNPLVVVDGVIVQGLGDVNPNDIESTRRTTF